MIFCFFVFTTEALNIPLAAFEALVERFFFAIHADPNMRDEQNNLRKVLLIFCINQFLISVDSFNFELFFHGWNIARGTVLVFKHCSTRSVHFFFSNAKQIDEELVAALCGEVAASANLPSNAARDLIAASYQPNVKAKLTDNTKEAVNAGCYGCPVMYFHFIFIFSKLNLRSSGAKLKIQRVEQCLKTSIIAWNIFYAERVEHLLKTSKLVIF